MATFAIDEDTAPVVARLLALSNHGAATARDLGLIGASDDEQLLHAALAGHIFVTHNERHFVLLHWAWQRWPVAWGVTPRPQHAGILILPHVQGPRHYSQTQRYGPSVQAIVDLVVARPSLTDEVHVWQRGRWVQLP